jgi:hypothetical protein
MGRRGICRSLVFVVLAAPGAPALASLIEIRWPGAGEARYVEPVAPGKFLELCGRLAPGQVISWSFESDGNTDFNIHYHVGKEVEYPEKAAAISRAKGELHVRVEQDYCWMWKNPGPAQVRVDARLKRATGAP